MLAAARDQPFVEFEGDTPTKKRFASYLIGYFHIDIAEVQTGEGKLRHFVAIDRTSKLAFARLVESASKMEAIALVATVCFWC